MKTNVSTSTAPVDGTQQYQQFPAQAARIPVSHPRDQLDTHQGSQANDSPLQRVQSREPINGTNISSPQLPGLVREPSWPVEGFHDLHLSASEPRIFPGIVSRHMRRDSLVRKSSMSETDDYASASASKKGKDGRSALDGVVNEEEEDSDAEMEEAGGMDE